MKFTAYLSLFSLALAPFAGAQNATSPVVGLTTLAIQPGTSLVVPTLTNASVYTGNAAISANGLTITPVQAPGWTVAAYAKTNFALPVVNYPTHYVEIISGAMEGTVIDINTNTATAVTPYDPAPVAVRGTTVQVAVRQHVTLDKVIQGATGLSDYADAVSVFNSNGTQSVRIYAAGSFVADDFSSQAGHTVIYPGSGFVLTANAAVGLQFIGDVKATKTKVPLYAGSTNIVGPLNPASSTLLYGNASLAAALSPYADAFAVYSGNGAMAVVGTYGSDGSAIYDGSFNTLPPSATDNIPLNRAIVVTVGSDTTWTINSPIPPAP